MKKKTDFSIRQAILLFWLCTPILAGDLPIDSTKQPISIYDANSSIGPVSLKAPERLHSPL